MTFKTILKGASGAAGAWIFALGLLASCNTADYLKVTSPTSIQAKTLESPSNAALLVNGAVSDFDCAFGAYVVAGGLIGQELQDATQTADRWPYDQRLMLSSSARYGTYGCESLGFYTPMQTARVSNDNVRKLLIGWTDAQVPGRQALIATAAAYEAYAQLLLGEGGCSTVFSTFNADKTVNYGTEITPVQAFDSAITHFTEAITAAQAAGASANNILYMAYDGRARAKLDKGDYAGAKADAQQVPAGFHQDMTASGVSSRRYNRVWADNGIAGGLSNVNQGSSVEAYYRNMNDPRVPVVKANVPNSVTGVPIYVQTKYAQSTPIPIASYTEAQLIIAEADIAPGATNNPAEATAILNASRAAGNEPPLLPTDNLQSALIEERRRALFLQGEHLYDLIRFKLPLVPAAGATYPAGGQYGTQLCMPLPDAERFNNPKLSGA